MGTVKRAHNPGALVPSGAERKVNFYLQSDKMDPISNLPEGKLPAYNPRDFQIQRLQRKVSFLRVQVKRLSDANNYKDQKIRDQIELW